MAGGYGYQSTVVERTQLTNPSSVGWSDRGTLSEPVVRARRYSTHINHILIDKKNQNFEAHLTTCAVQHTHVQLFDIYVFRVRPCARSLFRDNRPVNVVGVTMSHSTSRCQLLAADPHAWLCVALRTLNYV